MLDISVARQVDGVAAGSTLTFQTWYDIEDQWDYGYVEASANGVDWVPLQQVSALPAATDNVNGSSAWNGPGGLTGNSGGWQAAEYSFGDLSGTVWIRFRYMTDEVGERRRLVRRRRPGGRLRRRRHRRPAGPTTASRGPTACRTTTGRRTPTCRTRRRSGKALLGRLASSAPTARASRAVQWLATQYTKQFRITAVMSNRPDGVFNSIGRLTVKKIR